MPAKETRESIEAELNGGERERLLQKFRELVQNCGKFERALQEREAKAGLPTYVQSKPIVERMAAVGMIDHVKTWMDSIVKINDQADAELSGAELLEGIVQNHRKA